MRGRGDSGRETTVPARGGFPERTLRQDELRAERPAVVDDDIFGDLYLDFEDAPTRAPVEPPAAPEPAAEPAVEARAPRGFDDTFADGTDDPAPPADRPEFDHDADPAQRPDPDHAPAGAGAPDGAARAASPWDRAPRPAETFGAEGEDAEPAPDPVPHTVTPPAVGAQSRAAAVPPPPTIAGAGSTDATVPAAHAVPPPPSVPPMPTEPPRVPEPPHTPEAVRVPQTPYAPDAARVPETPHAPEAAPTPDSQTELLPVAVPAADTVEEPDELDVPTTSRSDSLRRAEATEEEIRARSGPPLGVQASAWSTSSHPGRRRAARRERRGLGPELSARDNDDRYAATGEVFIVADGLGGHPAGWYAADVAVRTLVSELAAADLSAGWSDRLGAAIAVADLAVRRHGVAQYEGMRTTVVAAVLQHGRLHLAGCGDSVCWLVRGGRAFRLTEQGNAAEFGRPWLLTSTPLGGSQAPEPELQRIELHPGDRVVLATDGVGHLPDETVADLVHGDPFHAATTLTRTAVESGDDDATAVVVECDALPVPEGHRSGADPREQSEDASGTPGALRSDGGTAW
ncbi:protein phosphatase 2C domain-containing protein [Embleya sp. NPDC020630]|uniref:protein phosphatase 2C domain-containing protein n=1 Tax=Embleya sp. NPDC020630 TaxID=3363979 RepID=UPI0037950D6B